jgi:hypothetical protein
VCFAVCTIFFHLFGEGFPTIECINFVEITSSCHRAKIYVFIFSLKAKLLCEKIEGEKN